VDYATLQKKLSPFQLEKLTYLFRCLFDCNQDGVIDVSFKGSSFKNFKKVTIIIGASFIEFNLFFSSKAMTSFCLIKPVKCPNFVTI
jgi:hypothetical protein